MKNMKYKGYIGQVEFDDEDGVFYGRVEGIRDVVTFQGTSVEEIRQAFWDSVDAYLEFCKEIDKEPDRNFSGEILYRTTPEIHHRIFIEAQDQGKSMSAWISLAVDDKLSRGSEWVSVHGEMISEHDDF